MSVYETQPEGRTDTEHATIVEEGPRWKGPFPEYNRYGEPTGARYVRCSECGAEVLEGETEHASHRAGCDGVDDRAQNAADARKEPTRSEPADFGGGETTGVQKL